MICLLALVVFSFLGIFSFKYRRLSAEALDCVFRRVTFRPCVSRLDERIRAKIISKLVSGRMPKVARFVSRNFEALSWIFVILSIASAFFAVQGVYNYLRFGNCNGEDSSGFCIYNATGIMVPAKSALPCPSGNCTANCTLNCTPGKESQNCPPA